MVGTTIGGLSGLRTGISAAGPLVAGVLIALDLPHVFVLLHMAINIGAAVLAWRLLRALQPASTDTAAAPLALVPPVTMLDEPVAVSGTRFVELDGGYVLEVAA
jgi:hypothetical protein